MVHVNRRTEGEPHDELTRLGSDLIDVLKADPRGEEVQAIIMLSRRDRTGISMYGFPDDMEAVTMLFMHLRAIMRVHGKEVVIAGLGQG